MNRFVLSPPARAMPRYHPDRVLPWFFVSVAMIVGLLLFLPHAQSTSLETVARSASVLVVILLAINARHSPKGIFSVSSIYLLVFTAFHFGLVLSYALGLVGWNSNFEASLLAWFETPSTCSAVVLAVVAAAGFVAGKMLAILFGIPANLPNADDRADRALLASAGSVLLLTGCTAWFVVVVGLAQIDILGRYDSYYTTVRAFNISHIQNAIVVGMVVTLLGPRCRLKTVGLLAFGAWAVAVMMIGQRGLILFPLVGAVAVVGMRKVPFSPAKALIGTVVLLSVIAAIREVRTTGVRGADQAVSVNPVAGMIELGGSLRPVRETVLWIQDGDSHSWGASFWAPFDRALYYLVPGWSRPEFERDERLMANLVEERVGSIGFSNVAEAYYNFGPWGVAVEFLLIGFVLGRMDFWPARPYQQTIVGVCLIPLLAHVRNTFTPVPAQIILGIVFINLLYVLVKSLTAGESLSRNANLKPRPLSGREARVESSRHAFLSPESK